MGGGQQQRQQWFKNIPIITPFERHLCTKEIRLNFKYCFNLKSITWLISEPVGMPRLLKVGPWWDGIVAKKVM